MTRVVVELAHDINYAMPALSKAIAGCAYSPLGNEMGFRVEDCSVVVNDRRMIIVGADNEEKARMVMDWLNDKFETSMRKEKS
jgi:hypothetical protein